MNAKCLLAAHHLTRILARYSAACEIKEMVRENEMNFNYGVKTMRSNTK